jgi:hypothetical protein
MREAQSLGQEGMNIDRWRGAPDLGSSVANYAHGTSNTYLRIVYLLIRRIAGRKRISVISESRRHNVTATARSICPPVVDQMVGRVQRRPPPSPTPIAAGRYDLALTRITVSDISRRCSASSSPRQRGCQSLTTESNLCELPRAGQRAKHRDKYLSSDRWSKRTDRHARRAETSNEQYIINSSNGSATTAGLGRTRMRKQSEHRWQPPSTGVATLFFLTSGEVGRKFCDLIQDDGETAATETRNDGSGTCAFFSRSAVFPSFSVTHRYTARIDFRYNDPDPWRHSNVIY